MLGVIILAISLKEEPRLPIRSPLWRPASKTPPAPTPRQEASPLRQSPVLVHVTHDTSGLRRLLLPFLRDIRPAIEIASLTPCRLLKRPKLLRRGLKDPASWRNIRARTLIIKSGESTGTSK